MGKSLVVLSVFGVMLACGSLARVEQRVVEKPMPSDVAVSAAAYSGKTVEWKARQVRITTELQAGQRIVISRAFVLIDTEGRDIADQIFLVDGGGKETEAAQKLSRTKNDSGVRIVRGVLSGMANAVLRTAGRERTVYVPQLKNVAIEAPTIVPSK